MDEYLANAEPAARLIYGIISLSLMAGGLIAMLLVLRLHRRHPPKYEELAARMANRSWSTGQMALMLGAFILLYLLALLGVQWIGDSLVPLTEMLITLLLYAVLGIAASLITRRRGESWSASFGLGLRQSKTLLLSPLFYLAILPVLMAATVVYQFFLTHFLHIDLQLQYTAKELMGEWTWLKLFYAIVAMFIAPFFEELVFRGVMFPYFAKRIGVAGGTAVVSLCFSALHLHIPSLVPLYLLSVGLCLAYWRTGSLWPGIGMHALFNTVTIVLLEVIG